MSFKPRFDASKMQFKLLYIIFLLLSVPYLFAQQESCGVFKGKDKSGTEKIIDLSALRKESGDYKWRHDSFSEFQLNICKDTINCKGTDYTAVQLWQQQCIGLGKSGQWSIKQIVDNDIDQGIWLIFKGGEINFDFGGQPRIANIKFVCNPNEDGSPTYLQEGVIGNEYVYDFEWRSKHACARAPSSRTLPGLGVGGLILIIVSVLVILYFVAGIAYNKFKLQKSGLDVVPQYTFWISIPGLVKDGVMFVVERFKRNNYQSV